MPSLFQLFHEWLAGLYGPLVLPLMLFLLWGGKRWRHLSWLTLRRKPWLVLWGGYGLVKGITVGVLVWVRYVNDPSGGIPALDWATTVILEAFQIGYSAPALIFATLLGTVFETAVDCGLGAISWWVFEWASSQESKNRRSTIRAGLALIIPSSLGIIAGGPRIWWPMPTLIAVPWFLLPFGVSGFATLALPTIVFFLWNPQLFREEGRVPKRTYLLFACAVLLNILWFTHGWSFGVKYQGAEFTYTVSILNGLWAFLLALLFIRSWKRPSFHNSLTSHWLFFAWLVWYAFPVFGELP